jgi:hypothetical protein
VIELGGLSRKARLGISQALPLGQLGKRHDAKLLRACERAHTMIAAVSIYDRLESRPRQEVHALREQRLFDVHVHPRE